MGWKSTIDLTREVALSIVSSELNYENISDDDLAELVELVRGGENHGHNYRIIPPDIEKENCNE